MGINTMSKAKKLEDNVETVKELKEATKDLTARQISNLLTKLENKVSPELLLIQRYKEVLRAKDLIESNNEEQEWDEKLGEFFDSLDFKKFGLKVVRGSRFERYQQRGLTIKGSNKNKFCEFSIEVYRDMHVHYNSYIAEFEMSDIVNNIDYYGNDSTEVYFEATKAGTKRLSRNLKNISAWLNT